MCDDSLMIDTHHIDTPSKNHLFLDLDETLVRSDAKNGIIVIRYRPHILEFLRFCMRNFHVSVWSAGEECYVDHIAEKLSMNFIDVSFENILSRQHCSQFYYIDDHTGLPASAYYKSFEDVIWNPLGITDVSDVSPSKYTQRNTLLLDDNAMTHSQNPGNALMIRPWVGDETDEDLLHAIPILQKLAMSQDINRDMLAINHSHCHPSPCMVGVCLTQPMILVRQPYTIFYSVMTLKESNIVPL